MSFSYPSGDQLRVLGAKVDDENSIKVARDTHPIPTRWLRWSDLPSVCSDGAIMTSAF